jgi:hypothetical protein
MTKAEKKAARLALATAPAITTGTDTTTAPDTTGTDTTAPAITAPDTTTAPAILPLWLSAILASFTGTLGAAYTVICTGYAASPARPKFSITGKGDAIVTQLHHFMAVPDGGSTMQLYATDTHASSQVAAPLNQRSQLRTSSSAAR